MSSSQFEAFVGRTRHRIEPINWFLASSLVIALAAAWPLLSQSGFLNTRGGGDSPFLLQRVQQLGAALADGHFPVRWMPDACYGYGYPFFNFYAPLSIYFTSVINLLGVGLVWAVKISQLLGFVAGAWAIFALGRRWFGSGWAGLLTSAAYTLAPFHMVNVYVRGDSLAEFWAMAFFPVTILLADDLTRALLAQVSKRRMRAALLFSLSIAALILSHNISALIFTPFILLYFGLVLAFRQDGWATGNSESNSRPSALVWYFGALAAGMLLSSWFWLPAIVERSLAQLAPVTSGYFRFTNHFRGLDLIQLDFLFDYDAAGGRAFSMGVLQAIAALAGAAVIIYHHWRGRKDPTASGSTASRPSLASVLFIVITVVTATFMITPLSKPLWELLPFLEFTQFPWRFLSIQAFAAALAAGGLALLPSRKILVPVTVLLISVSALAGLQPDFIESSDVDLSPKNLAQYEWFTANIGSTVSAEYLPETVMPRPYTSSWLNESDRNSAVILDGHGSSVELVDRSTSRQIWRTDISATRATVAFPVLYWPGWTAEVDGEEFAIEPASGSGMIKIDLPSGEHEVEISLGRTPVRWLGEILSLLVLGAMVTLAIRNRSVGWWRGVLTAFLTVLILVVIGQLMPSPAMDSTSHSWDSAQLSYLHPSTDGIPFEDGSLLRNYTYNRDEVAPGDELLISFSWDPPPSAEATLDLHTPAVNRFTGAPPLVSLSLPAGDSENTVKLPIPENAPAGMYLPRIVIDGAPALTSSGSARGPLFLQPVLVSDSSVPAEDAGGSMEARAVRVRQAASGSLEVQLQWLVQESQSYNFNFSLRLVDSQGFSIAQFDNQPGYGYLPSSLWPAGRWVNDWLVLSLPPDLHSTQSGAPYSLVVRLYEVDSGRDVLIRRLGELDWAGGELLFKETEPGFTAPTPMESIDVTFGDKVSAVGLDVTASNDQIMAVIYWQAIAGSLEDFRHFVHLINPASGEIVAQHDAMPLFDTYPTSQWSRGEYVSDPAVLDISEVPAGSYQLIFGLYQDLGPGNEPNRFERLSAIDGSGKRLENDAVIFAEPVLIER